MLIVRSRITTDRRESDIGNAQIVIRAASANALGPPADVTEVWRGRSQTEYGLAETSRTAGNWVAYWINESGHFAEFDTGTLRVFSGVGTDATETFTNLATSGTNIIAQYAAGAPIDDAAGTFVVPYPFRSARVVLGAGGANPVVYTIDGLDSFGATAQEVITAAGAGTYEGRIAWYRITRLRSNIDPVGTTDLRVGNGVAMQRPLLATSAVIVDSVPSSALIAIEPGSGCVVLPTAPDGAHDYIVRYR